MGTHQPKSYVKKTGYEEHMIACPYEEEVEPDYYAVRLRKIYVASV